MTVYLLVITKVEKRPFLWASKLGTVSHSTKIPSEKTNTRPASKIEETRCWREKRNGKTRISKRENVQVIHFKKFLLNSKPKYEQESIHLQRGRRKPWPTVSKLLHIQRSGQFLSLIGAQRKYLPQL